MATNTTGETHSKRRKHDHTGKKKQNGINLYEYAYILYMYIRASY